MLAFYVDKANGYVMEREVPDIWTCVGHFIFFAIVREITFYYSHRLLHHPYLYKRIHKKHHTWISPIAIAAAYCHPLEHVVSNVIPIALGTTKRKYLYSQILSIHFKRKGWNMQIQTI